MIDKKIKIIKKVTSFFSSDLGSVFAEHLSGKILIYGPFTLIESFGFHGAPLRSFKTDRLGLRALDLGVTCVLPWRGDERSKENDNGKQI